MRVSGRVLVTKTKQITVTQNNAPIGDNGKIGPRVLKVAVKVSEIGTETVSVKESVLVPRPNWKGVTRVNVLIGHFGLIGSHAQRHATGAFGLGKGNAMGLESVMRGLVRKGKKVVILLAVIYHVLIFSNPDTGKGYL